MLDVGEANTRCFWEDKLHTAYIGPFLIISYQVIAVVMLLNMLIAMMSKTFDDVWAKMIHYRVLSASTP